VSETSERYFYPAEALVWILQFVGGTSAVLAIWLLLTVDWGSGTAPILLLLGPCLLALGFLALRLSTTQVTVSTAGVTVSRWRGGGSYGNRTYDWDEINRFEFSQWSRQACVVTSSERRHRLGLLHRSSASISGELRPIDDVVRILNELLDSRK
jgi:hypothetical protein